MCLNCLHQKLYARLYDRIVSAYEPRMRATRAGLLSDLEGSDFAELGPGTGSNLPFIPAGSRWIGIEPNRFFHEGLLRKARGLGLKAEVLEGYSESLPLPEASVDAVICTLVLCSVSQPQTALQEVRRVLRPGGKLYLMEHVAAPRSSWLRWWQNLLSPFWKALADGCRLNQDTGALLEAAGFAQLEVRPLLIPPGAAPTLFRHHLLGSASR